MTIKTDFGNITATKDTLKMLAVFMNRAAIYYNKEGCIGLSALADESSLKIFRAIREYCNNH